MDVLKFLVYALLLDCHRAEDIAAMVRTRTDVHQLVVPALVLLLAGAVVFPRQQRVSLIIPSILFLDLLRLRAADLRRHHGQHVVSEFLRRLGRNMTDFGVPADL